MNEAVQSGKEVMHMSEMKSGILESAAVATVHGVAAKADAEVGTTGRKRIVESKETRRES